MTTTNNSDPERSRVMRAVKSKDTKPEMTVRRLIYSLGYRYRLHVRTLPGNPDLVFPGRRKVIFVHGCFWHGHDCSRGSRFPKTNQSYWRQKLSRNQERDKIHKAELELLGWHTLTIWECELKEPRKLAPQIEEFLSDDSMRVKIKNYRE